MHWFHAFNRDRPPDIMDVLIHGPGPNPDSSTRTRRNEALLEIAGPCIYAYLGRTNEGFGQRAVVVRRTALTGVLSPFDTGGLVEHIRPVCEWTQADRVRYVQDHSWDSRQLAALVSRYPGADVQAYLYATRPSEAGPHELLPCGSLSADIWACGDNTWQAWTWEGRSKEALDVGANLVAWTCQPDEYAAILQELGKTFSDESAADACIEDLMGKYCDGGVSILVAEMRASQEDDDA